MDKKWTIRTHDEKLETDFSKELGVTRLVAGILLERGISDTEEAKCFLDPVNTQPFYDPFLLPDMNPAVGRIKRAIENNERITVYGDYDVDGISAVTILMRGLRRLGADVSYYIPNRHTEGYGIHTEALEKIAAEGASLLVSVDCGITSVEAVEAMTGKLDIIITDHHLPEGPLPEAIAVIDAHRDDSIYPYADLCGAGVAFKLCQALFAEMRDEPYETYTKDIEIAALGTIADLVPLKGENRKITAIGLTKFQTTELVGLRALIEAAGCKDKKINAGHVGFSIAPRLNAAGRLETASKGAELLLTQDETKAAELAAELSGINSERQGIEQEIFEAAEQKLENIDIEKAHVIVVAGEDWNPGVIGLAASKLTEKYYRPSIVIGIKDGVGKGSCRSIDGFHIFEALSACKDDLIQFGGHAMAAGLTVDADKIGDLRESLEKWARENIREEVYQPVLKLEAELPVGKIDFELMKELEKLEPYGMGNPRPLFADFNVTAEQARSMGKDGKHLMMTFPGNFRAIMWNHGEDVPMLQSGAVDIAYVPEINEWNGNQSIEARLSELRETESRRINPTREILAGVYRVMRSRADAEQTVHGTEMQLAAACGVSTYTYRLAVRIFEELGLMQTKEDGVYVPASPEKRSLEDSETFRRCSGK